MQDNNCFAVIFKWGRVGDESHHFLTNGNQKEPYSKGENPFSSRLYRTAAAENQAAYVPAYSTCGAIQSYWLKDPYIRGMEAEKIKSQTIFKIKLVKYR